MLKTDNKNIQPQKLGIYNMVPRDMMTASSQKLRDTFAVKPYAPFYQTCFGLWMCLDHWFENGLDRSIDLNKFFFYDQPGLHDLRGIGWCEAEMFPFFEEKIVQEYDDYEIVQDKVGRQVKYFKGRRQGFMPEYISHPVKDMKTWQENIKWRLNSNSPQRYDDFSSKMNQAQEDASKGNMIQQSLVGGYMYLRSLIGPEDLLYFFYDKPELIHDCMKIWLDLADGVICRHQQFLTIDILFLAEDICYNHGPLISPDMIKEFLFPYYQQLIQNIKKRQLEKNRHLYIQVDSDGNISPVIELYMKNIGAGSMCPFEVASGCDVVEIGKKYSNLIISGGIDKRILAQGVAAIDSSMESILPIMRKRGGYIPTCDHGVPVEVKWEDYLHFRKKCVEYGT